MTTDANTIDAIETAKTEAVAAAKKRAKPAKAKKQAKGKKAKPAAKAKAKKPAAKKAAAPKPRAESKQARFIAAMRTAKGISIAEAAEEFGWQKHTVRGAVAGAIRVKLGLKVDATQDEKRGTVYRIAK